MLHQIIIDDFATIEHITIDIGPALNIITGETGAGKSVLVEAISTALGGRADISMVRTGALKSVIQIAGELNGNDVIISRELFASGKSVSKLNGELLPLNKLKTFCRNYVDVHGQYDNQQILDPDNHITITDKFKSDNIGAELDEMKKLYFDYNEAKRNYDQLLKSEAEAKQQKDYFNFELEYINNLNLQPNEDTDLLEQLDIMSNSAKIFTALNSSYQLIYEDDNSVLASLSNCKNLISSISSYSSDLSDLSSDMDDMYYKLEDISSTLRSQSESINFSEEDMDEVSERLNIIEDAKRKYSKSIAEILDYRNNLDDKLQIIQNFDEEKTKLLSLKNKCYEYLKHQADLVSKMRKINASKLESAMIKELKNLNFANSEFKIKIDKLDTITENGYDKIEFFISTNPGEPLRPLTKTVSGGEISRIMLAFKHIIGDNDKVPTMIFDEIDNGISGKAAVVVGKKLKEISQHHQIICITHLPQIAACGDDNYMIQKKLSANKSHTVIEHLNPDEKIKAIAALISGTDISENAVKTAKELISKSAD